MFRCQSCHAGYLDPRPNATSIDRAYQTYFTHDAAQSTDIEAGIPPSRVRLWVRACLNSYRNAHWHMALAPSNTFGCYLVTCAPPLRAQVHQQMRHLPRQPPRPGAQLLDVGCGNGAFLELARTAGWHVRGLDFDPKAVASARKRGLDVVEGNIEQLQDQATAYDWICCSHVIEHVHNPIDMLQQLHSLLRPGGTLWLQTPNIASLGHERFGPHWRGLEPPRHLTLFTPDGLQRAVANAGLSTEAIDLAWLANFSVHRMSQALAMPGAAANRHGSMRAQLKSLVYATRQNLAPQRAEFITLLAKRPAT